MKPNRTIPLIKNIFSTNVPKIKQLRVIDNKREIKKMTFSPDERFLLVNDKEKSTLYDLTDRAVSRIQCPITHDDDVFDAKFIDDNNSFIIISQNYIVKRYTLGGTLIGTSDAEINLSKLPHHLKEPFFRNHLMIWLYRENEHNCFSLNVYDFVAGHHLINNLELGINPKEYHPVFLGMRDDDNRIILFLMQYMSQKGTVLFIDIDAGNVTGGFSINDIIEYHALSKCGRYLGICNKKGEYWTYDLSSGYGTFIQTYNSLQNKGIFPFGQSSFIYKSPLPEVSYEQGLTIYEPGLKTKTTLFNSLIDLLQVSDNLEYFVGMPSDEESIQVWDVKNAREVGRLKKSPNMDFNKIKLSPKGKYLAAVYRKNRIYIYQPDKLPSTITSDLGSVDINNQCTSNDKYFMYECTLREKGPYGETRSFCRFLEYSKEKREIIQKGDTSRIYNYNRYLGDTGFCICSYLDHHVGFYSIESGAEIFNLRVLKIPEIHSIAASPSGNRIAVISMAGKMLVYDTSYLKDYRNLSVVPVPRCINKIRLFYLFNVNGFDIIVKFISVHLVFVGDSHGNIKILNVETSAIRHQNRINSKPFSIEIINDELFLIVCREYHGEAKPIRLFLWNLARNEVSQLRLIINKNEYYDFDSYKLCAQNGIVAMAVNKKGVFTINIHRLGDYKRLGDFFDGGTYRRGYGLFKILSKKKKLLVVDIPPWTKKKFSGINDSKERRIRVWDLDTGRTNVEQGKLLEDYWDIKILLEKYIILWTVDDDFLKMYDLDLNELNIMPLMNCTKIWLHKGKLELWKPDKVVAIGRGLNVFQIIEPQDTIKSLT